MKDKVINIFGELADRILEYVISDCIAYCESCRIFEMHYIIRNEIVCVNCGKRKKIKIINNLKNKDYGKERAK